MTDPMREWTLELPWLRPPLNLNHRGGWRKKAALTKQVRHAGFVLARSAKIPHLARVRLELFYQPPDRRPRDTDNLVATLKPLCDGVVDAGVVIDDIPQFMEKPEPVITLVGRPSRLWLRVVEIPPVAGIHEITTGRRRSGAMTTRRNDRLLLPSARDLDWSRHES